MQLGQGDTGQLGQGDTGQQLPHLSVGVGVQVLVAEGQNSGSMLGQFGIETVIVRRDTGELKRKTVDTEIERIPPGRSEALPLPFLLQFPVHPSQ